LNNNLLSGSTDYIGDVLTLVKIDLSSNFITGEIPTTIGQLTDLTYLNLANNSLHSTLPTTFGSLSALTLLDISDNSLFGPIPPQLSINNNLFSLDLRGNMLSSSLPTNIGAWTKLTYLDLSMNRLTGTVTSQIGLLTNLVSMSLFSNSLDGVLPTSIGALMQLTFLNVGGNDFTGAIPSTLALLTNLRSLIITSADFTGAIPASFCQFTFLTTLDLSLNFQLTSFPDCLNALPFFVNTFPTSQPTGQPTGRPSDQPSGQPSAQPTSMPTKPSCIEFTMVDTFGDGWNTGFLHISDTLGFHKSYQPTESSGFNSGVEYCIDPRYTEADLKVTVGLTGVSVLQPWEEYWTAKTLGVSEIIGTYGTFVTFKLDGTVGFYKFKVDKFHDVIAHSMHCAECTDAANGVYDKVSLTSSQRTSSDMSSIIEESKIKFITESKLGLSKQKASDVDRVRTDTDYRLYGLIPKWSSWNGYGTVFDVSSLDGTRRYFTGGLCGRMKDYDVCPINKLKAGAYVWRVTGMQDSTKNSIAWEFCGVHGGASTEVIFELDDKGDCAPITTTMVDTTHSKYSQSDDSISTQTFDSYITQSDGSVISQTDESVSSRADEQIDTQIYNSVTDALDNSVMPQSETDVFDFMANNLTYFSNASSMSNTTVSSISSDTAIAMFNTTGSTVSHSSVAAGSNITAAAVSEKAVSSPEIVVDSVSDSTVDSVSNNNDIPVSSNSNSSMSDTAVDSPVITSDSASNSTIQAMFNSTASFEMSDAADPAYNDSAQMNSELNMEIENSTDISAVDNSAVFESDVVSDSSYELNGHNFLSLSSHGPGHTPNGKGKGQRDQVKTKFTMTGSIVLQGKNGGGESSREMALLSLVIADLLQTASLDKDVTTDDVNIKSWNSRMDDSHLLSQSIVFELSVTPESFGYDFSLDKDAAEYFLSGGIHEYLQTMCATGMFLTELKAKASSLGVDSFRTVEGVSVMIGESVKEESYGGEDTSNYYSMVTSSHIIHMTLFAGFIATALSIILVVQALRKTRPKDEEVTSQGVDFDEELSDAKINPDTPGNYSVCSSGKVFTKPAALKSRLERKMIVGDRDNDFENRVKI